MSKNCGVLLASKSGGKPTFLTTSFSHLPYRELL